MNKRMRELLAAAEGKREEARKALAARELDEAKALLDEVDAIEAEYELTERAFAQTKAAEEEPVAKALERAPERDPEAAAKAFGAAAKRRFKAGEAANMSEGSDENGGYLVPEDVTTAIEHLREAKASLLDLVQVTSVKTDTGARTYRKRATQTGFSVVDEGGAIAQGKTPTFARYTYTIKKYAGFFALTNELLRDSDQNVAAELMQWIADESRVTANNLILAVVNAKAATPATGLDDIKKALNVTLGQAFAPTSTIVTNDDGFNWLDTLKNANGDYLLKASPTDALQYRLAVGARSVPVKVIPNGDLPSSAAGKLPFVVGDLKEGVTYFDRQRRSVMSSDVAAVGELNAFDNDLTLYRAIEREDVVARDESAWVRLELDPAGGTKAAGK